MESAGRLPALDGLRAISILLVLSTHMLPLGPKILGINDTAGPMGMSLFFALSGFLITSGLIHNSSVCDFLIKRLARIVPLAYAYSFIVFTIVIFDPKITAWTASFLVNYFDDYLISYNAHFWSLCVEVHFYLAIAIIIFALGRKAVWMVWPACFVITALRIHDEAHYAIMTHLRVDEILAGACVATIYRKSWEGHFRYATQALWVAVILWFLSSSPYGGALLYVRPYATAFLLAIVLCHDATSWVVRGLSTRSMRYFATISYALYVIHPATLQGWWNDGTVFVRYLLKRPLSFALTFFLAHVSTFYWERFWQEAASRWIARRRKRRSSELAQYASAS
jgi:peptidoglycan/LPS O-acetylase OafA/YrhL